MIAPLPQAATYHRLAAVLRERIEQGELPPGAKLPSESRLSQEHGLSRGTVRAAVAVLRGEGLVVTRAPYGTFVREADDRVPVAIQRGSRLTVRMPTPTERRELDIDEGVPVLAVEHGARRSIFAGDRHLFTTA